MCFYLRSKKCIIEAKENSYKINYVPLIKHLNNILFCSLFKMYGYFQPAISYYLESLALET